MLIGVSGSSFGLALAWAAAWRATDEAVQIDEIDAVGAQIHGDDWFVLAVLLGAAGLFLDGAGDVGVAEAALEILEADFAEALQVEFAGNLIGRGFGDGEADQVFQ